MTRRRCSVPFRGQPGFGSTVPSSMPSWLDRGHRHFATEQRDPFLHARAIRTASPTAGLGHVVARRAIRGDHS